MKIATVDIETYYDKDYSLSKLQTDAYVLDARYETIGVAVHVEGEQTQWFSGDALETAGWLHATFDWKNLAVVCHNTLFDGFIMTQRFGVRPKLWMDTLGMARLRYPYLASHSLANLAKHFNLEAKGTYVVDAIGKHRADFSEHELSLYADYCMHDVHLTRQIYQLLLPSVPPLDLRLIDMTVRMFTEPQFVGDEHMMQQLYADEVARKVALTDTAGTTRSVIMSNDKLAAELRARGVTPPQKVSPKTGKTAWAFAKSDKDFQALLEHADSDVQALVAARLGVKTTIAETRAMRMLETSRRDCTLRRDVGTSPVMTKAINALNGTPYGALPVYLNFWGAKVTGRYSGGNQINWQNLPARGASAGLRKAIMAPPGYKVVVGDSSNIELRVAMCAAGQEEVIEKIVAGHDLYCDFASKMFGRTIFKPDKKERMLGKIAMLSLQYGAGWRKFKEMVRLQSGETLADDSAENTVRLYRRIHWRIVDMWERMETVVLPEIHNGCPTLLAVDVPGWCLATGEGFGVGGGPGVVYHKLRQELAKDMYERDTLQWVYTMGRENVKLYGGKCLDGASLVLTEIGWKRLDSVGFERVHDGVAFVAHGGIVFNGVKGCIAVDGVLMTPDHKVLTDEGWKTALEEPRPYRPDLRHVDGAAYNQERREEDALDVSVFLRESGGESGGRGNQGSEARRNPQLRVQHLTPNVGEKLAPRHESPSGVRGVAQYVRSLSAPFASGVAQLRGAGHSCMRTVAGFFQQLLGGYGQYLPDAAYVGASEQHARVQQGELRVGNVHGASQQPAQQRASGEAQKAVYDIINCGPRHRFVVLGAQGPFIVHNCFENYCQHVARQIVMWQTARINERYPVALSVHDEAVCVVKDELVDEARAYMEECLSMAPPWCRGQIPLACEIGVGQTYGDAK